MLKVIKLTSDRPRARPWDYGLGSEAFYFSSSFIQIYIQHCISLRYIVILYPSVLPDSLVSFFGGVFRIIYELYVSCKQRQFYFFLSDLSSFYFFFLSDYCGQDFQYYVE